MSKNNTYKLIVLNAVILLFVSCFIPAGVSIDTYEEYGEEAEFPYPGDDWAWSMIGTGYAHQMGEYGDGVRIAVLDTGIDYNHPDLEDKMWEDIGYDFVDNDDDPMDHHGHGTHVAGIISSVAPEAELMALRVIEEEGGDWIDLSQAVEYARDNGADIISMSFGGQDSPMARATEIQIQNAYTFDDILHVAAAGNADSDEEFYPAGYDSVISVSAVDSDGEKASYSNYGDWIEMAAPGGDSQDRISSTLPDESYGEKIGTSMAAPFVTGAAALRRSLKPQESNDEVREFLQETAIDIGDEELYGYGLVNAYRAAGGEVPTMVQELKVEPDDSRVDLSWELPWYPGVSEIEGFRIYRGEDEGDLEYIEDTGVNETYYEDSEVENEAIYYYSVTAFNEEGESFRVTPIRAVPREEPIEPFAPEDVEAELLEDGIKIRWEEPIDDGGSPIIGYNIYREGENGEMEFLIELDGETHEHLDETINPDTEYRYAVSAVNDVGEGERSYSHWVEVPEGHVPGPNGDEVGPILPEWLEDREIPVVPTIIVLSGFLLFIMFSVALYRRRNRYY